MNYKEIENLNNAFKYSNLEFQKHIVSDCDGPHGVYSTYLFKAIELIKDKGWIQNHLYVKGLGYCVRGALLTVISNNTSNDTIRDNYTWLSRETEDILCKCEELICLAIGVNWKNDTIPRWNDSHYRTKEEVLSVLLRAATRVESNPEIGKLEYRIGQDYYKTPKIVSNPKICYWTHKNNLEEITFV